MLKSDIEKKQEVHIMKIFPWFDCTNRDVVGVRYALGEHYEKLDALYKAGWSIDAQEYRTVENGNITFTYPNAQGLLIPEPENPVDSEAIAVYLRLKANKKDIRPQSAAVRIGYLSRTSDLRKYIKHATIVPMQCEDMMCDDTKARDFRVTIFHAPLKLTSKEYKDNANFDQK